MPRVAFILLSYNSLSEAARLAKLLAVESEGSGHLVLLVDNASPQRGGYDDWLACSSANVLHLELPRNGGYSSGNNAGIDMALRHGIDNVVVLNPDIGIEDVRSFVHEIVEHFMTDDFLCLGFGVHGVPPYATPISLLTLLFPTVARAWDRLIAGRHPGRGGAAFEVGRIHGCGFALRAAEFRRLGLFDEDVFLYMEEAIVTIVARRNGRRVLQSNRVWVDHGYGRPDERINWFAYRCQRRSTGLILRKYFHLWTWASELVSWLPVAQQVAMQATALLRRRLSRALRRIRREGSGLR